MRPRQLDPLIVRGPSPWGLQDRLAAAQGARVAAAASARMMSWASSKPGRRRGLRPDDVASKLKTACSMRWRRKPTQVLGREAAWSGMRSGPGCPSLVGHAAARPTGQAGRRAPADRSSARFRLPAPHQGLVSRLLPGCDPRCPHPGTGRRLPAPSTKLPIPKFPIACPRSLAPSPSPSVSRLGRLSPVTRPGHQPWVPAPGRPSRGACPGVPVLGCLSWGACPGVPVPGCLSQGACPRVPVPGARRIAHPQVSGRMPSVACPQPLAPGLAARSPIPGHPPRVPTPATHPRAPVQATGGWWSAT
jgi:hypothetical protein